MTTMDQRPAQRDVALAVAVALLIVVAFAFGAGRNGTEREITHWSYIFGPAAALLLAFRRLKPVQTLLAIAIAVLAYVLTGGAGGPIGLPIWIALYTVAAQGSRQRSVFVAIGAAIGVSVLVFLIGPEDPTALEQAAAVGLTVVPVLFGDAVRSRRALVAEAAEQVRLAEAAADTLAQNRIQNERVRIARELHDVVAHSIATINVQAGVAAHVMDSEPTAAKDALIEIKHASKTAMGELRAMLGVLRSTDYDQPNGVTNPLAPSPTIDDIASLVERSAGHATLHISGSPAQPVDAAIQLVAYRIVQEALTNSLKHVNDAIVNITLEHLDRELAVTVIDDGGSGPTGLDEVGGLGLVGLDERARSVGGTFAARPLFGGGFKVEARLPYRAQGVSL